MTGDLGGIAGWLLIKRFWFTEFSVLWPYKKGLHFARYPNKVNDAVGVKMIHLILDSVSSQNLHTIRTVTQICTFESKIFDPVLVYRGIIQNYSSLSPCVLIFFRRSLRPTSYFLPSFSPWRLKSFAFSMKCLVLQIVLTNSPNYTLYVSSRGVEGWVISGVTGEWEILSPKVISWSHISTVGTKT